MQTSNSGKLSYLPINDAHAIVEVVFFIQFSPDFSKSTIKKLLSLEHDLKSELPKADQVKKVAFQFDHEDQSSAMSIDELIGITLQSIKKDGSLEWMLRTTENTIAVHCLDYEKWDDVWLQAKTYLERALIHIEGSNSFVSAIGLKYVDKFLYKGTSDKSDLSELFNTESQYVVKTAFDHKSLWHSHSGWFDSLDEFQCLNQLNIDANFINVKGSKTLAITIDHNAIAIIDQEDSQVTKLDAMMGKLHLKNKQVLTDLLSKEMQKRINL